MTKFGHCDKFRLQTRDLVRLSLITLLGKNLRSLRSYDDDKMSIKVLHGGTRKTIILCILNREGVSHVPKVPFYLSETFGVLEKMKFTF